MKTIKEYLIELQTEVGRQQATVDWMKNKSLPKEIKKLQSLKRDLVRANFEYAKNTKDWLDPLIKKSLDLVRED